MKYIAFLPVLVICLAGCREPNLSDTALSLNDDSPIFSRAAILSASYVERRLDSGLDPNIRSSDDAEDALLTYAVRNNAIDTVDLLLRRGADPEIRSTTIDKTPLFQAAFDGHFVIAWLLIDAGANANATDRLGHNALREAIVGKRKHLVRLLLKSGSDPTQVNDEGKSMADIAREFGTPEIVKMFE